MKKLIKTFNSINNKSLIKQYFRLDIAWYTLIQLLIQGLDKKSLEIVRLSVNNKVLKRLRKKYKRFINNYTQTEIPKNEHTNCNKIWSNWFQGIDNAPKTIKVCYDSLKKHLPGKEIIVITDENYKEYVTFPKHIEEKYKKGIIGKVHMSDLLRLELLTQYGGTWIDSTVYCSSDNIPEYMLNSELFLFQNLKPGLDGQATTISSWFITASSNNKILLLTRALLHEYWKHNNKAIDYFIIHDMFQLAIETYPEEWKKVIPFSNSTPHILLLRLYEQFNEYDYKQIIDMTPFHKLTHRIDENKAKIKNTYYKKIFNDK